MIKFFWTYNPEDIFTVEKMRDHVHWAKLEILEEKDLGEGSWEWTLTGKKGDLCLMINSFCGCNKTRYFIGDLEVFEGDWEPSREESEEVV